MHGGIFITDLPSRVVGGFTPASGVGTGWIAVDWKTTDLAGVGLATGYDSGAGELVLDLGLEGEYILYLGLGFYDGVRVWLDGENGFREMVTGHGGQRLMECRLHRADLTGRKLHLAPIPVNQYSHEDTHLFVGYIRAVRSDYAPRESAGNMVVTNDGYSWIALDGMDSVRDVSKHFEVLRDSDVRTMLWNPTGADVSGNHLSKVGTTLPFDQTHAFRRCDRQFASTTEKILTSGGDILQWAVDSARAVGVGIQFYLRPEAFYAPFPYHGVYTSQFLLDHPEWRCRDEYGREIMRMSYAYRQVQDHMIDYIDELLAYEPDGICLAFPRSLPMMICEEPLLALFQERYGREPKLPEECDKHEMVAVRQAMLGEFIARLHAHLAARGKTLSCIAELDNASSLQFGLNIEEMLKQGLFESVFCTGYTPKSDFWKYLKDTYRAVNIYSSLHYIHSEGTSAPNPYDHTWQATALKEILAEGFAGSFFWDIETMNRNPYNWHVLRHGGTPDFLDKVIAGAPELAVHFENYTETLGVLRGKYDPLRSY